MKLNDILFDGASGKFGHLFFRTVRGQVYLSTKPITPQSGKKRKPNAQMNRFRLASKYASAQMRNELSKAEYETGINRKKSTAYLVALTDYLNAPVVHDLDTRMYTGNKGDTIRIRAEDDFMVIGVKVAFISGCGEMLEEGEATPVPERLHHWKYKVQSQHGNQPGTIIRATAYDKPGNATTKEVAVGDALSSPKNQRHESK
jgi:hypothetical protein